jgi:hypothetical protein
VENMPEIPRIGMRSVMVLLMARPFVSGVCDRAAESAGSADRDSG